MISFIFILSILKPRYVQKFGDDLSTVMGFTMNVSTEELSYGPKLNKALSKMVEQIESVPEPSLEEVKVVARNVLGINNPVSNPQQAFHVLIKKVVLNSFKVHVMTGVDDIAHLMTECVLNYLKVRLFLSLLSLMLFIVFLFYFVE